MVLELIAAPDSLINSDLIVRRFCKLSAKSRCSETGGDWPSRLTRHGLSTSVNEISTSPVNYGVSTATTLQETGPDSNVAVWLRVPSVLMRYAAIRPLPSPAT